MSLEFEGLDSNCQVQMLSDGKSGHDSMQRLADVEGHTCYYDDESFSVFSGLKGCHNSELFGKNFFHQVFRLAIQFCSAWSLTFLDRFEGGLMHNIRYISYNCMVIVYLYTHGYTYTYM